MTKKAPSQACLDLQENVVRLIAHSGKSRLKVAKESGIAPRTLNYIVKEARGSGVDTVERIAEYFGIPSWLLLVPGLQADRKVNKQLAELVNNFILANPPGREQIVNSSKREAEIALELKRLQPSDGKRLEESTGGLKRIREDASNEARGNLSVSHHKLPRKKTK